MGINGKTYQVLDLFSGVGGFSLGLERAGMHTIGFCEIDPFCQKVLRKHWPDVPIHDDIQTLNGADYAADVVCGGFPCQPYSQAGQRRGADDDRALWPEMRRVIREVQPAWVIAENVIGLESMGLESCVSDLEGDGFAVQVFDIPACGVGAPHRRHRLWIVAHANGERRSELELAQSNVEQHVSKSARLCDRQRKTVAGMEAVAHDQRRDKHRITGRRGNPAPASTSSHTGRELLEGRQREPAQISVEWPTEPPVCGTDDGISRRVDRLRALGNAVVPQIPELIGRAICAV